MKYTFIAAHREEFHVERMSHVLGVGRSGFYAWFRRGPGVRALANQALLEQIHAEHEACRKRYGSPRIHVVLRRKGVVCGKNRVARLMRIHGIVA